MNVQLANRITDRILNEQFSMGGGLMPDFSTKMGITNKDRVKFAKDVWGTYKHEIMMAAEIGALFIPAVGPFISMAISMGDAALYWNEGDRYTAGFVAVLTAIPLVGSLLPKIPGVKKLGAKGIKLLAEKMKLIRAGKKPALSQTEKTVLIDLGKNQKLVVSETGKYFKKAAAKKAAAEKLANFGKAAVKGTGKTVANYAAAQKIWNWVYTGTGIQQAEIAALIEPSLVKLKPLAKATESKLSLDTIIREEIAAVKEQFGNSKGSGTSTTPNSKPGEMVDPRDPNKTSTGEYTSDDTFMSLINNSNYLSAGIVLVIGYFVMRRKIRIARAAAKIGKENAQSLFKNPVGFIKSWQQGKALQSLQKEKWFRKLSKENQDRVEKMIKDPKSMTGVTALAVDDAITKFANGSITAAELKSILPPDSLAKYKSLIDSIERSRAPKTANTGYYTSTSSTAAKPTPPPTAQAAPKPNMSINDKFRNMNR